MNKNTTSIKVIIAELIIAWFETWVIRIASLFGYSRNSLLVNHLNYFNNSTYLERSVMLGYQNGWATDRFDYDEQVILHKDELK